MRWSLSPTRNCHFPGMSKSALSIRIVAAALVAGVLLAAAAGLSASLAYILGLGLVKFAAYSWDKWRAVRGGRRLPERSLIVLSLVGGAMGGWAGMVIWRHKTQHTRFWLAQVAGTSMIAALLVLR
jgi:uncharacterized membrane protein YsdA (DUF1294 family)